MTEKVVKLRRTRKDELMERLTASDGGVLFSRDAMGYWQCSLYGTQTRHETMGMLWSMIYELRIDADIPDDKPC